MDDSTVDAKTKAVYDAINKLYGDLTVTEEVAAERMEYLRDRIDDNIACLGLDR